MERASTNACARPFLCMIIGKRPNSRGQRQKVTGKRSKESRLSKLQRRNFLAGLAFTSPFIVGFLIFTLYPLITSLYYSFTSYKILAPPIWIGFKNYSQLYSDELFWTAISNTLFFTAMAVPL